MEFTHLELQAEVDLWIWPTNKFKAVTCKLCLHQYLGDNTTATALLPFVFSRGTAKWHTTQDIAKHMADLYGAQYECDVMKIGENQLPAIELAVINQKYVSDGKELLESGLDALVQLAFYPYMPSGVLHEEYVTQEKRAMHERISGLINNKRSYARQRFYQAMFANENYRRYKYGTVDDLPAITAEALTDHWKRVYAVSPIYLFVVGEVEPEKVAELLQDKFPKRDPALVHRPEETAINSEVQDVKVITETEEVNQAVLYLGYRAGITAKDPLYYGAMMANGILGGFPHSKLFVNVREKASLAYYASSRFDGSKGTLFLTAGISPKNYQKTVDIMQEQVTALQHGDISDYELDATRKGLTNWLTSVQDSAGAAIDRALVSVVQGQDDSVEETIHKLHQVTKDDVVAAASQFKLDTIYCLTAQDR